MAILSLRRSLTGALAALVLSGGAMLSLAPAASAGVCGEHRDPWISGAKAYWEISCWDGKVTVSGWGGGYRCEWSVRESTGDISQWKYAIQCSRLHER